MVKIVALAAPFADTGKNGNTAVLLRNGADELSNDNRLANTCTAKKPNLSTFHNGADKVNDFDPCFQNLRLRCLFGKIGSGAMDRITQLRLDRRFSINGVSERIKHGTE